MITLSSQPLIFSAWFSSGGIGKTGLSVSVVIRRPGGQGSVNASATEIGDGWYQYTLASGSTSVAGQYIATFTTADSTVDWQNRPAAPWTVGQPWTQRMDQTISSAVSAANQAATFAAEARGIVFQADATVDGSTPIAGIDISLDPTPVEVGMQVKIALERSGATYYRRISAVANNIATLDRLVPILPDDESGNYVLEISKFAAPTGAEGTIIWSADITLPGSGGFAVPVLTFDIASSLPRVGMLTRIKTNIDTYYRRITAIAITEDQTYRITIDQSVYVSPGSSYQVDIFRNAAPIPAGSGGGSGATVVVSTPMRVTDWDGSPVGAANNGRVLVPLGNTAPSRDIQVTDSCGVPVDLTGCTIRYHLVQKSGIFQDGAPKTILASATVVSGPGGLLRYFWAADGSDTNLRGLYHEQWDIVWPGDPVRVTTVPASPMPVQIG